MTKDELTGLNVASWPGKGDTHNPFINIFLNGLEANGCRVESLDTVEAVAEIMKGDGPDILLLHWAERVFGEGRSRRQILMKMWRLLRAVENAPSGTRVVWVVHNLAPHDARRFQRLVWPVYIRSLARKVDAFLTLAPDTVAQVRAGLPQLAAKPGHGAWHPAYPDSELSPEERRVTREEMGFAPEDRVLGYCGQIRPYKGVEDLLDTFVQTTAPDLRLLLSGRPQYGAPGTKAFLAMLEEKAARDHRVVLRFDDLTAAEYRSVLGACDVIVAPFRRYLHSGSIIHALSAKRPILTPATPFANSLETLLGTEWVRQYKLGLTPELLTAQKGASGPSDLSALAPNAVGQDIVSFLGRLQSAE